MVNNMNDHQASERNTSLEVTIIPPENTTWLNIVSYLMFEIKSFKGINQEH